jgi:uncharacterized protein (DUF885 family)
MTHSAITATANRRRHALHMLLSMHAVLFMLLAGCQPEADAPAESPADQAASETTERAVADASAADQQTTPSSQLDALYEAFDRDMMELNPVIATFRGIDGYNDRWANSLSSDYRRRARELDEQYLQRARDIGSAANDRGELAGQDQLSYQMFIKDREMDLRGMQYPGHLMPINQFRNPVNFFVQLGSGNNAQPFNTAEDYRNFISRADDFSVLIEQAISNMRDGMAQGYVQPRALMVKVLPQLAAHVVDDPEASLFYQPLRDLPEELSAEERDQLIADYTNMISATLIPSIRSLHDFIQNDYLPSARETSGMTALPGGDDWYAYLVERTTTTDLSPDRIHQIGLAEVARIHSEIRAVMQSTGFDGDMRAFFEFTKNDPQFLFESRDAMLAAYNSLLDEVDAAADQLFKLKPEAAFEIRPVEAYREKSASSGAYQRPAADGSRPGIFYLNTYDLSARPSWAMTTLFLHEAIPGHHFQLALQQELQDLPPFRRFGGDTAYVEGWGLYAESLGKEMGVYEDPYQYYGTLIAELWRAIRLVVDTGLHLKGWSREQVLDYMYANAPVAEARAVSEAERFMAIPSQALAYKIGQLKIQELRVRAESELGDDFDVREFHALVLGSGSLPLTILEQRVDDWITRQQEQLSS